MSTIFLIARGTSLLSHPFRRHDNTYRTCVVAAKEYMVAQTITDGIKAGKAKHGMESVYKNDDLDDLDIREVHVQDEAFYKMLRLNNFALLFADDVHIGDSSFGIQGEIIEGEYDIVDSEHRTYLDHLLKNVSE